PEQLMRHAASMPDLRTADVYDDRITVSRHHQGGATATLGAARYAADDARAGRTNTRRNHGERWADKGRPTRRAWDSRPTNPVPEALEGAVGRGFPGPAAAMRRRRTASRRSRRENAAEMGTSWCPDRRRPNAKVSTYGETTGGHD